MNKLLTWLVLVLAAAVAGCSKNEEPAGGSAASTNASPAKPAKDTRSAEDVFRAFMLAMMTNDRAALTNTILPNPDADILWQGEPPPAALWAQIKAQIAGMTFHEFKVGDTWYLPGGKGVPVTSDLVGPDKKLLAPSLGGKSLPTVIPMQRINGEWKVDAASLIASREKQGATR